MNIPDTVIALLEIIYNKENVQQPQLFSVRLGLITYAKATKFASVPFDRLTKQRWEYAVTQVCFGRAWILWQLD